MPKAKPLVDRRLVGYWKSDRARTFRDYVPREGHTPEALRKFKSMFGKLVIKITKRNWSDVSDKKPQSTGYEVIAMDSKSVVIRKMGIDLFDDLKPKEYLTQIHFDGPNHFWVWEKYLGDFREFFKRIPAPKKRKRSATSSAPH